MVSDLRTEGPAFESKLFLKIYLYGYLDGIWSRRRLEKVCVCNLELHWLCNMLQPNYHCIADFQKENPTALKMCSNYLFCFWKRRIILVELHRQSKGYMEIIASVFARQIRIGPLENIGQWKKLWEKTVLKKYRSFVYQKITGVENYVWSSSRKIKN